MKLSNLVLIALAMPMLSACSAGERTFDLQPSRGGTPRDRHALDAARRASGSDVAAWEAAAARALRSGLHIDASFRERVRLPDDEPHAVAWRFPLQAGQSLRVRVDAPNGDAVFPEIFHAISGDIFRHVYATAGRSFEYTARVDGSYVLRLQTPVGAGGLFDVTVTSDMTAYTVGVSAAGLMFPVVGRGLSAIGSVWGDVRDGGARSHEGVDIFAPRGTPVVAVADGRITGVRHTTVGGRVVWLDDPERSLSFYYAHLDDQLVRDGQWVRAGDTLGTVGNTGNAATTPPHLHFGVYRPGTVAVNPEPYLAATSPVRLVAQSRPAPATQPVLMGAHGDASVLGQRLHLAGERVRLRTSPSHAGRVVAELSGLTPLLVLGVVGDWHRVVLEDGRSGFVSVRLSGAGQGSMR